MDRKAPRLLDSARLWDYALKLLAGRALSSSEVREKLRRKAEQAADVDVAVNRLKELGLLNDRQFAESFASRRKEDQHFGKARVMSDLKARRVASAVAESAVSHAFEGTEETDQIEQFLARKFRRKPLCEVLADQKGMASVYRKLRMAGFAHDNSMRALKRHAKNVEAIEPLEVEEPPIEE